VKDEGSKWKEGKRKRSGKNRETERKDGSVGRDEGWRRKEMKEEGIWEK